MGRRFAGVTLLAVSLAVVAAPVRDARDSNPEDAARRQAARFLSQATFGADLELIDEVARQGETAWLEAQLKEEPTLHLPLTSEILERAEEASAEMLEILDIDEEEVDDQIETAFFEIFGGLYNPSRRFAWWQATMTGPDLVRQRVAYALSQIFVVSDRVDELDDAPEGLASYYDILVRGAFGNYRDLLLEVSLHPVMGFYLSHLNNERSDAPSGRFPDENYAREVMQLFSIGLFELNPDGSQRLGADGLPIPTYGNEQITEFAKIFTGLGPGGPEGTFGSDEIDFVLPMEMYEAFHEPGEKHLLNGTVVPLGLSGMEDIEAAVDNLFHHPNVGPFLGRLLIQRLVTSNPSPGYVARVSAAFADNGAGVRGDMKAVVRAILLDPAAPTAVAKGRLQEPFLRHVALLRAFRANSESGLFMDVGERFNEQLLQHPLSAPSVFNFYLPDHQPKGELSWAGLVGPEFQITTSSTIISMANFVEDAVHHEELVELPELGVICIEEPEACVDLVHCPDEGCVEDLAEEIFEDIGEEVYERYAIELDLEEAFELAEDDVPALLDRLDLLLTRGGMSSTTRRTLEKAIRPLSDAEERLQLALYLTLISPDAAVVQ